MINIKSTIKQEYINGDILINFIFEDKTKSNNYYFNQYILIDKRNFYLLNIEELIKNSLLNIYLNKGYITKYDIKEIINYIFNYDSEEIEEDLDEDLYLEEYNFNY